MHKLFDHFKRLFSDRIFCALFAGNLFILACFFYMWVDSGHMLPTVIGISFTAEYVVISLIVGRKWTPFQFLIMAFSMMFFLTWRNPLAFILVYSVVATHPKFFYPLYTAYALASMLCLGLAHRNWAQGLLHVIMCIGIHFLMEYLRKTPSKKNNPRLVLTEDEENIIRQLAEGKELKQIEGYSQNTVYTKLREARVKNGLKRNCQLVEIYVENMGN